MWRQTKRWRAEGGGRREGRGYETVSTGTCATSGGCLHWCTLSNKTVSGIPPESVVSHQQWCHRPTWTFASASALFLRSLAPKGHVGLQLNCPPFHSSHLKFSTLKDKYYSYESGLFRTMSLWIRHFWFYFSQSIWIQGRTLQWLKSRVMLGGVDFKSPLTAVL